MIDAHTIETRFYERGAGVTLSSGTGSTGAAVAAILRKVAASPVTVQTPAGESLQLRWDDSVYLDRARRKLSAPANSTLPASYVAVLNRRVSGLRNTA